MRRTFSKATSLLNLICAMSLEDAFENDEECSLRRMFTENDEECSKNDEECSLRSLNHL